MTWFSAVVAQLLQVLEICDFTEGCLVAIAFLLTQTSLVYDMSDNYKNTQTSSTSNITLKVF